MRCDELEFRIGLWQLDAGLTKRINVGTDTAPYVASFFLVAGFMRFVGGIAWWKSLLTSFLFAAAMFVTFDVAFDVIMPKGPLEALLGF